MAWFLAAFGLVVHVYFWGAALAVLLLPRRFERWWPGIAPAAGLALQSAVVFAAGLLPARGADVYAWPALLVPLALAGAVAWRRGRAETRALLRAGRGWWLVGLAQVAILWLVLEPFVSAKLPLTSASLGSCDAADYAAGARVFQEFVPDDRSGFLGHEEVVRVHSVRDFRTYFVRLNHFTPSAVMALNGAVLGLRHYQMVSLFTAVLPALLLPVVFLAVRQVFRVRAGGALALAAVCVAGPVTLYGVYQVAPGQIIAMAALALLTAAALRAFALARGWGGLWRWTGLLVLAVHLLAGSYNFILTVAFVPAAAWVAWQTAVARRWRDAARWIGWLAVAVAIVVVLFPPRFAGLAERFALFEQYDFGWHIPGLRPDGWLGAVGDATLAPARGWMLVAALMLWAGSIAWLAAGQAWRGRAGVALLTLAGPPLAGYALLLGEAAARGNNASYDAYKLFGVFLPLILGGALPWLDAWRRGSHASRCAAGALLLILLALNFASTRPLRAAMRKPPLVVSADLVELEKIETFTAVDAINLRIGQFWSRLWANAFLLRQRQYFALHTYEGRRPTPLRGDFDLLDSIVRLHGPQGEKPLFDNGAYVLLDRRASWFVDVDFGANWFEAERFGRATWRWSAARPVISIRNPHAAPMRMRLRLDWRAEEERELIVAWRGAEIWRGRVQKNRTVFDVGTFVLPPGENALTFDSPQPATPAPPGDPRSLLVALFGLTLELEPQP